MSEPLSLEEIRRLSKPESNVLSLDAIRKLKDKGEKEKDEEKKKSSVEQEAHVESPKRLRRRTT